MTGDWLGRSRGTGTERPRVLSLHLLMPYRNIAVLHSGFYDRDERRGAKSILQSSKMVAME